MSGTDFLFKSCDGKFTDEDLSDTGNRFAADYYQLYLADYGQVSPEQMHHAGDSEHDFDELANHLDYWFSVYSTKWKD